MEHNPGPSTSTGGFTRGDVPSDATATDEMEALTGLGEAYDQTEFEKDVLNTIDEQMREEERWRQNRELCNVAEEVKFVKQRLNTINESLIEYEGKTEVPKETRKKLDAIRREKDNKEKHLRKLEAKLRSLNIILGNEDLDGADGIDEETREQLRMLLGDGETEEERRIRNGEMTPFGTMARIDWHVREIKLPEVDMFDQFLDEKMAEKKKARQEKKDKILSVSKAKTKDAPRKLLLAAAKAAKRQAEVGTSLELLRPKKKKRRYRDLPLGTIEDHTSTDRWREMQSDHNENVSLKLPKGAAGHSDDSDYNPADDEDYVDPPEGEEERDNGGKKLVSRKKNDTVNLMVHGTRHRHRDDGDSKAYLARVGQLLDDSDFSEEEIDEDLRMPCSLYNSLYPYQRTGVRWLWELHQNKCGGIIGDEMGLGKTIQMISFLRALRHSNARIVGDSFRGLGPVILTSPATVMHQWVKEFHKWFPKQRVGVLHNSGSFSGKKKASLVRDIHTASGTLITSYQGIVIYLDCLLEYEWHYVILDEGHKIRNPDSQATLAVKQFKTPHRIILSGSPIQNNLRELWSLFDFVFPGKLGTLPTFMAEFAVPITQGGYANATETQVAVGYRCASTLRDTVKPYLLRRMKRDVKANINLPPKSEQVLFCKLTQRQRDLYKNYLDSPEIRQILDGRLQIFVGLVNLRKICNHPDLYDGGPYKEIISGNSNGSFKNPEESGIGKEDSLDIVPDGVESALKMSSMEEECERNYGYFKRSGKLMVVEALLKLWKKQGHRALVFSQSRQMLRILEAFIHRRGYTYLVMDGSTTIASRQPVIERFNQDKSIFVFLLTTRVGGLGVNLTGANRIIIYDPDWNPSTDMQARERAWRIGQNRDVTIYRLMTAGTIEEKIYHRQIFKQFLTNRILNDPRQRRFFKSNELHELFTLGDDIGRKNRTETSDIFSGTGSEIRKKHLKTPEKRRKEQEEKDRVERMRMIARKLSQKIGAGEKIAREDLKELDEAPTSKGATVEGERISGVVRRSRFKGADADEEERPDRLNDSTTERNPDDDYVLSKLFRNSSVHSVMKHDAIIDSAVTDSALVEAEAKLVAREAVKKLERSRKMCFRASSGIPNWTGHFGAHRGMKKARFGTKSTKEISLNPSRYSPIKAKKDSSRENDTERTHFAYDPDEERAMNSKVLSSSELMAQIRVRCIGNVDLEMSDDEASNAEPSLVEETSAPTDTDDLLVDLRNFIAFGAAVDGQATTQEILATFRDRVPEKDAPLFRSLLKKLCEFYKRGGTKDGLWRLRPEFR
ncbi:DNA excision repair protein ERCC-6-like [Tropilaelaps mercedesae]|uniref:DNA repair and recombination protein RAD54-like n=1 Tax=Tropilaelaps mercedesae TaxID=418985 RepID=A0A1V9XF31_9ACAR|nr:DNA excision repair protein ERCC-6-like [Tropilaelaps mercedesae]